MKSKKTLEKTAVKWFNKYICLRDLKKSVISGEIAGYCISCGKVWYANLYSDKSIINGKEWHAGHYWKSDRYASVRFNERNVNGQHSRCNVYKNGDEANYEIGLRTKIGDDKFEELKIIRHGLKHFTVSELEDIIFIYKSKVKTEAKRLGIKYY